MVSFDGNHVYDDEDFDGDLFEDDDVRCNGCDGGGTKVTCIDDMCRGVGECIHGDGEEDCPVHGPF
jgi:hypothetical protein